MASHTAFPVREQDVPCLVLRSMPVARHAPAQIVATDEALHGLNVQVQNVLGNRSAPHVGPRPTMSQASCHLLKVNRLKAEQPRALDRQKWAKKRPGVPP